MADLPTIMTSLAVSAPAAVLIKKIYDSMGALFRPHQIKRIAKAEAEAVLMQMEVLKGAGLADRAEIAQKAIAIRQQTNMESIVSMAIEDLNPNADPSRIDDDWLAFMFDKARLVSDEAIQKLWARVLSGEANSPGSFSKKTLEFLSTVELEDAELFSKLASFLVTGSGFSGVVYTEKTQSTFLNEGIDGRTLYRLHVSGFINKTPPFSGLSFSSDDPQVTLNYQGHSLKLELKKKEEGRYIFNTGNVGFTPISTELINLCNYHEIPAYFEALKENWKDLLIVGEDKGAV